MSRKDRDRYRRHRSHRRCGWPSPHPLRPPAEVAEATEADMEADMEADHGGGLQADMGVDMEAGTPTSPAANFRGGHFHHGFRRVGFWGGGLYA